MIIQNKSGQLINPATEEKLDDIVSNQEASNALIVTLQTLTETMIDLTSRLEALAGAIAPNATLRTTVIGTVTASGPITSAQHIANTAVEKIAIANLTAINSNINNTIG